MLDLKKPKEAILHYRITTPMFLGEADAKSVDAKIFRNASYKGALRFWWRATQWGKFLSEAGGDVRTALSSLHKKEGELFGLASDGEDSRQSRVRIQTSLLPEISRIEKEYIGSEKDFGVTGIKYLLGQGADGRKYIKSRTLQVTLQFHEVNDEGKKISADDIQSIESAAIALGLFGGLGSRARKGLGSLSLQTMTPVVGEEASFTKLSEIETFIGKLDFSASAEAPLTAFSKGSDIVITNQGSDALKLLGEVGVKMSEFRKAPENKKEPRGELPMRAVFGLPHKHISERRASPLFIHVHALEGGELAVIQTLLPAQFLPGNTGTKKVDFGLIRKYLKTFENTRELRRHD